VPNAIYELPDYKERVFVVGANGSGKSYFVARVIACLPRWFAIDLKGDFGEDCGLDKSATIITKPSDFRLRLFPRQIKRIIYRPAPTDYSSVDAVVGRLFNLARALKKRYGKGHPYRFYLYCDEGLLQSRGRRTVHLAGSAISGRSLEMGFILSSQRLSWIPVEIRTEAWRVVVFYLSSVEEEREVIKLSKNRLTLQQLEELGADYSFYELKRTQGGLITVTHFPKLTQGVHQSQ
jgi:hypothetical protein